MVSEDYDPCIAGVGVHLQNLVRELVSRGHHIVVVTSRRPHQESVDVASRLTTYRNHSVRLAGFYHSVTTTRRLQAILAEHDIDVVHVHFLSVLAAQARRAARRLGVRTVYTYHMADEIFTSPLRWMPPLQRWAGQQIIEFCNGFDAVTFPSAPLLDQARDRGVSTRSVLLGNAVAFNRVAAPAHGGRSIDDPFVLLFVGRLSPEKNLELLMRAFARVSAPRGAELWLVGDGPLRPTLDTLAHSLGIASRVKFAGYVPNAELSPYYAKADAFVLPSLFETQGMVCVEAMCFGKPLLVSDGIVSRNELVENGVNGFIFDHRDESDLQRYVERLAASPAAVRQMGAASRQRVATMFAPDRVIGAHEDLYRSVIASPVRAGARRAVLAASR